MSSGRSGRLPSSTALKDSTSIPTRAAPSAPPRAPLPASLPATPNKSRVILSEAKDLCILHSDFLFPEYFRRERLQLRALLPRVRRHSRLDAGLFQERLPVPSPLHWH